MKPIPRRVAARQDLKDWSRTEMLTYEEAAALLWPSGSPLTASSLRTAQKAGLLDTVMVARKRLTTLEAIDAMLERARRKAGT
ncbi:hypothetical protein [Bradyrhizobium diazoefficiens]|uniref:hypothetical protein n=1 Tax=Bradyrhizobium diazoefficiens TaxID=1355477 RepID=UPI0027150EB2|nr:hypothetical protein [Bradyrhizobium diazoefficiens]WLC16670.1 hypothetical protein QIH76_42565 [Bradyrhizobium diazoefficiens]